MTSLQDLIDDREVFTPMKAANYLGIGKSVAYAMFNEPGFPCFHIGRRKFVVWSDLYAWLKENKTVKAREGGCENDD